MKEDAGNIEKLMQAAYKDSEAFPVNESWENLSNKMESNAFGELVNDAYPDNSDQIDVSESWESLQDKMDVDEVWDRIQSRRKRPVILFFSAAALLLLIGVSSLLFYDNTQQKNVAGKPQETENKRQLSQKLSRADVDNSNASFLAKQEKMLSIKSQSTKYTKGTSKKIQKQFVTQVDENRKIPSHQQNSSDSNMDKSPEVDSTKILAVNLTMPPVPRKDSIFPIQDIPIVDTITMAKQQTTKFSIGLKLIGYQNFYTDNLFKEGLKQGSLIKNGLNFNSAIGGFISYQPTPKWRFNLEYYNTSSYQSRQELFVKGTWSEKHVDFSFRRFGVSLEYLHAINKNYALCFSTGGYYASIKEVETRINTTLTDYVASGNGDIGAFHGIGITKNWNKISFTVGMEGNYSLRSLLLDKTNSGKLFYWGALIKSGYNF